MSGGCQSRSYSCVNEWVKVFQCVHLENLLRNDGKLMELEIIGRASCRSIKGGQCYALFGNFNVVKSLPLDCESRALPQVVSSHDQWTALAQTRRGRKDALRRMLHVPRPARCSFKLRLHISQTTFTSSWRRSCTLGVERVCVGSGVCARWYVSSFHVCVETWRQAFREIQVVFCLFIFAFPPLRLERS